MDLEIDNKIINEKIETNQRFIDYFFAFLVGAFLFSLFGLQKFVFLFFLNKVTAGLIIIISLLYIKKFYFTDAIKIYSVFIFISLLAGALFAKDVDLHFDIFFQMFQLVLLLVCVSQFYIFRGNINLFMFALIAVGFLLCIAGRFLDPEMVYSGKVSRYSSISANSNGFAFQLLFSSIAALYFFRRPSLLIKIAVVGLIIYFSYYIALSGSRKSSLAFLIIILSWIYFSFPLKKSLQFLLFFLLVGILAGSYFITVFEDTAVMQRFAQLEDDSGGTDIRASLYLEAFHVFQDYPIFGVGLNNFRLYSSSGLYAHSNYMELLANTGLVGFALFMSVYFIVWRKGDKIQALHPMNTGALYYSGLFRTSVILFLVLGLGSVFYNNIAHWFLLLFPVIMYEREKLLFEEIQQENELINTAPNPVGEI